MFIKQYLNSFYHSIKCSLQVSRFLRKKWQLENPHKQTKNIIRGFSYTSGDVLWKASGPTLCQPHPKKVDFEEGEEDLEDKDDISAEKPINKDSDIHSGDENGFKSLGEKMPQAQEPKITKGLLDNSPKLRVTTLCKTDVDSNFFH